MSPKTAQTGFVDSHWLIKPKIIVTQVSAMIVLPIASILFGTSVEILITVSVEPLLVESPDPDISPDPDASPDPEPQELIAITELELTKELSMLNGIST